jgi:hypothetical protein
MHSATPASQVGSRTLVLAGLLAIVTTVACGGTHPAPRAPSPVEPAQSFAVPYRDVKLVAELAALRCPLVLLHAQSLGDSARDVSDSARQIIVMDKSEPQGNLVRLRLTGSRAGPTVVSVAVLDSGQSDSAKVLCGRRILAGIAAYVLAQHTGDSTPLIDSAMNVGSTPTVLAVAGGDQGARSQ